MFEDDPDCEVSCELVCDGNICGDNGCGGSCGECGLGEECSSGSCESISIVMVCDDNSE